MYYDGEDLWCLGCVVLTVCMIVSWMYSEGTVRIFSCENVFVNLLSSCGIYCLRVLLLEGDFSRLVSAAPPQVKLDDSFLRSCFLCEFQEMFESIVMPRYIVVEVTLKPIRDVHLVFIFSSERN